jgi:hypothetical protein
MPFLLGKKPAMARPQALMFAHFVDMTGVIPNLPNSTNYWSRRSKFPLGTWGNDRMGDCTIASQIVASMRNERIETRRTDLIAESEGPRVYVDMSNRLYGGGDNGAYEEDALANWRKPDLTFRDKAGNPITIDAFTRLDPKNHDQIKAALWLSGGTHGIKVCFNLPSAWQTIVGQSRDLDVAPNGGALVNEWEPGSWGGHSMYADDYDLIGLWVEHTWNLPRQRVTWAAVSAYSDEAHSIVDSIDTWRHRASSGFINLRALADAVNQVSDQKIAA